MEFNKKAISPVVATALLLVVAVVAVVGFQTWFNTYQSGIQSKVEQNSDTLSSLTIDLFDSSGTIYVKNTNSKAVNIKSVSISSKVGTTSCSMGPFSALKNNVTSQYTIACNIFNKKDIVNIVLVTNGGVFSAEKIVR